MYRRIYLSWYTPVNRHVQSSETTEIIFNVAPPRLSPLDLRPINIDDVVKSAQLKYKTGRWPRSPAHIYVNKKSVSNENLE